MSTRRPLIGVSIGLEQDGSAYLRLRSTYPRAIERAGGAPVLIPPLAEGEALRAVLEALDGVVLPGGADVDPAYYGETPHPTVQVNAGLDRLDLAVARWAVDADVPTLAICRGQQVLNVACGGKLLQHVEGHRQGEPRDALTHAIMLEPGSRLAGILGDTTFSVNSHHHQVVRSDALGRGLRAVGWSEDGLVEALEADGRFWVLAVQFHPEDLVGFHAPSQRLFEAFVQACAQRSTPERVAFDSR